MINKCLLILSILCFQACNFNYPTPVPPSKQEVEGEPWCGTSYLEENTDTLGLDSLATIGKGIFVANCMSCHILGNQGVFPDLVGNWKSPIERVVKRMGSESNKVCYNRYSFR